MDNRKTGQLIANQRKLKNMTQQELAEKLHVTNTAVSKWERGLSFPGVDILEKLAIELDITVMDILAGEITDEKEHKSADITLEIIRDEKRRRKRICLICAFAILLLSAVFLLRSYGPAVFQRGYPMPYIKAMFKLSDDLPFVKVMEGVYLTEAGDEEPMIAYVEQKWNIKFAEQAGSGYIFSNGQDRMVISSEIYWGRYTVWDIPDITLQTK